MGCGAFIKVFRGLLFYNIYTSCVTSAQLRASLFQALRGVDNMDLYIASTSSWATGGFWVIAYGVALTLLLVGAVVLSAKRQHTQGVFIAKIVALGALAPLGSWLMPAIGGPWVFGALFAFIMLWIIAQTAFRQDQDRSALRVAQK